ncbi:hemolysin III family protein [Pyxidicoccus parkwayensis]|uniref:Hemolysin III family protein n=1 Tax=Pyxidicoccus parkwayensis TaxID=2813578 RepID=A0ABX7PCT6_9BACT|nr:hemolysin III family protein [Pyxidicoccus parkwaysis]QSQ28285.1 hemolysin III family protein [Pyxidicoccus parkwaysis]
MSARAAEKPKLRGVLHQFAAASALGAGGVLVSMAPTPRAAAAAALYAISLVVLFSVSATYHRVDWSPRGRAWMRRLDHASIFILIAGTYTPVALLGVSGAAGDSLLLAIWCGAFVGVLQSLFWVGAPKVLTAALAVAVGWTLVPYLEDARRALGVTELSLILAGGVAYTTGAIAYALKRPDLRPGVFGYHELFHALTLVGAGLHFAVVLRLVRAASA